jgi:hypothetical protein
MTLNINDYTGYPPHFINGYLVDELKRFGILTGFEQMTPIFPTSPTNIEDVFSNYVGAPGIQDPLLIQYERLLRFRPSTMYAHKREQLMFYLYSTNLSKVLDSHRIITEALDREDAAAQDVNSWSLSNNVSDGTGGNVPKNVFFHNIKVYQADETRDLISLATARTVYANKLIVEYDYHVKKINSLYS